MSRPGEEKKSKEEGPCSHSCHSVSSCTAEGEKRKGGGLLGAVDQKKKKGEQIRSTSLLFQRHGGKREKGLGALCSSVQERTGGPPISPSMLNKKRKKEVNPPVPVTSRRKKGERKRSFTSLSTPPGIGGGKKKKSENTTSRSIMKEKEVGGAVILRPYFTVCGNNEEGG